MAPLELRANHGLGGDIRAHEVLLGRSHLNQRQNSLKCGGLKPLSPRIDNKTQEKLKRANPTKDYHDS